MGKIRVTTVGETDEKLAKKREAKKATKKATEVKEENLKTKDSNASAGVTGVEGIPAHAANEHESSKLGGKHSTGPQAKDKKAKTKKVKRGAKRIRSTHYKTALAKIDKSKNYNLNDALDVLLDLPKTKFDESVELHFNLIEKIPTLTISLPHGIGREIKVAVMDPTKDTKAANDLLKEMESGKINFDILIAHPSAMPMLAKVARILGPKGLMPNPKNGTISSNTDQAAKNFLGGQVNFKPEAKQPVLHTLVGKVSFGKDKLKENIESLITGVNKGKIKSLYLKSTMSPSIRVNL